MEWKAKKNFSKPTKRKETKRPVSSGCQLDLLSPKMFDPEWSSWRDGSPEITFLVAS